MINRFEINYFFILKNRAIILKHSYLISPSAQLEEGVQIMHGCIIQPGVNIKAITIIRPE